MRTRSVWFKIILTTLFIIPLACQLPTAAAPTPAGPANVETFAVQLTITALSDLAKKLEAPPAGVTPMPGEPSFTPTLTPTLTETPTMTWTPTFTVTPSVTSSPTTTVNPTPCNAATFVSDVSIPDNTEININKDFVKTWRIRNIGTCTWTSGYRVIFDHGDQMGAPGSASFTGGTVAPGATVDISVSLKAPGTAGTYQGFFRLKSSDGQVFGIGANANGAFWVKIKATEWEFHIIPPLDLHVLVLPDLQITSITFDPNPPKADISTHVHVKLTNNGGETSNAFTVKWWGLTSYGSPSCTWNVASIAANTYKTLQCDFTYPSAYAPSHSKATADTGNTVLESNEGNNTMTVNVTVGS